MATLKIILIIGFSITVAYILVFGAEKLCWYVEKLVQIINKKHRAIEKQEKRDIAGHKNMTVNTKKLKQSAIAFLENTIDLAKLGNIDVKITTIYGRTSYSVSHALSGLSIIYTRPSQPESR